MTIKEMDDFIARAQWQACMRWAAGVAPTSCDEQTFRLMDQMAGITRVETAAAPPPDELSVLIDCTRTSAQDTLDALHRKGWKIIRDCEE